MAYQGIGTGTLPNDDTGDNLRNAGIKINDNFSELYSHFGDGTNLTAIVGTGIATESGIVGTGVTLIEFKGSAVGEVVVESGIATITVSDFQESLYGDTDVNTHLNLSSAGTNEVLSYDGSDYTWVSNAGYTNSNVDTHLNQSNPTAGYVLSWNGTDYAWVEQSGGSDGVAVQEEGSSIGTATTINFVGTGVTATFDSGIATVSIIGIPTDTGDLTNNVGFATTGALVGLATTGALVGLATTGALVGLATTGALVGFITSGDSGAGLTELTGAEQGTYGNGTNSAQITVDANGRITSIGQVAISGGGGGGGISGINVYDNEDTSLGVTTNISFNNNLNVVSIGDTLTVSVTGVVTSLVGYATEGYVDNAVVGLATTGALVGLATTGALVGLATTGALVGLATTGALVGLATTGALVGLATTGALVGLATTGALVGLATTGALVGLATTGALVGFITSGDSGAGLTALTGATEGTWGNATNVAEITVDANGRITGITNVAISGGGGGGGISGINVFNSDTSLGVTTNINFGDNLNATAIGSSISVSVTGVVTSVVGLATTGALVGFITSGALVGYATTGALVGLATTGALVGLATTGALVGLATTGALVGLATTGALVGLATTGALVGLATTGALVGLATTGALVGFITSGALVGYATTGALVGLATTGALVGLATTGALVGLATTGALVGLATTGDVFSGDYNDLTNKPTIPASQDLDNVLGVGNTSSTGMSVGLVTATAVTGFNYLQAPHDSTVTFNVTVASKDSSHRYNGTGSGSGYLINGVQAPFLTLTPGRTYRFTNNNTGSHPLKFYLEADKTTEYTSGVSFQNSYTEITVSDETPTVLHYQCTVHGYMGNAVQTNSNKVNSPYVIVGSGFSTASGTSSQFLKADGTVDSNTYLTSETSHSDVLVDGDFSSEGFMKRGATPGTYSIDSNTYLTTTGDGSSLTGIPTDGDFTSNGLMKRTGAGTYSIDSNTYLTTESDPIVAAINGIVKSDGSTISTATSGTDYLAPSSDGSGLSGIVTSIVAGTNITLTGGPTGIVTINSGTATTTGTFTATAGAAYTANTYTSSDFVTTEYTLFFQHSSGIQSQKVLVMDDETTAYSQEYAIMSSNSPLVSVGATIKSSNVELWFTPEPGVSGIITYKFTRETIS